MRALLDANIYISYLLSSNPMTPPDMVVEAALDGVYTLLLTNGVITELRRKTATKPYLKARISQAQADLLVRSLLWIAEDIPELGPPLPEIGHDRKDDYLFAHAVVGGANCLISGDIGVQGVGKVGDVQVVNPAAFVRILRQANLVPDTDDQ